MKKIKNIFGEGIIYKEENLKSKLYTTNASCVSICKDLLFFTNNYLNKIVKKFCSIDLVILNDIKKTKERFKRYILGI